MFETGPVPVTPNVLVPVVFFGWIPLALGLFFVLTPRRAVLASFLGGSMFLPVITYTAHGVPDFTRETIASYAALLGVLLFDRARLTSFRPRLVDLPILVWCVAPLLSSMSNGLGLYDGFSGVCRHAVVWGIPYVLGRVYVTDPRFLRDLAVAIVIGGLIYVPLCLIEMRLSPQLHRWIYGYHQHQFVQTVRFGGFRPTVFMPHGLAVGMFMTWASLAGIHLLRSGVLASTFRRSCTGWTLLLCATTVACKSLGALVLLAVGLVVLWTSRLTRSGIPLLVLAAVPALYCGARAIGGWQALDLVDAARRISVERASSLHDRIQNENLLLRRADERPFLGWGGWGRSLIFDDNGEIVSVIDGAWIIALGTLGIVGMVAQFAVFLLPMFRLVRDRPVPTWFNARAGPEMALAMILCISAVDNLFNAHFNPVLPLMAGALLSATSVARIRTIAPATVTPLVLGRGPRRRAEEETRQLPALRLASPS